MKERPAAVRPEYVSRVQHLFSSRGEQLGVEEREEGHRPGSNDTGKSGRTAAWVDKSRRSKGTNLFTEAEQARGSSEGLSVEVRAGWEG